MDFGLDKLLVMLEERFGRRAATAVMLLLIAAICSWCLHEIYAVIVRPLYYVVVHGASKDDLAETAYLGLKILLAAITTYLGFLLVFYIIGKSLERKTKAIEDNFQETERRLQAVWNKIVAERPEIGQPINPPASPPPVQAPPAPQETK